MVIFQSGFPKLVFHGILFRRLATVVREKESVFEKGRQTLPLAKVNRSLYLTMLMTLPCESPKGGQNM